MAKRTRFIRGSGSGRKQIIVGDGLAIASDNADKLTAHIKERAEWSNEVRTVLVDHYEYLDQQLFGHIKLDADDRKRQLDNQKGKPPQPVDANVQFIWSQIDDAVTDLLAIIVPDGGTYGAYTNREQQDRAQGVARKMNNDASQFQHYDNYAIAAFQMFSKNFGGVVAQWTGKFGTRMKKGLSGAVEVENGEVYAGNAVEALDVYNTLLDPTVDPIHVHSEGEFFITIHKATPFRLRKMENDGELFSASEHIKETEAPDMVLWRDKPSLDFVHTGKEVQETWESILTMGAYGTEEFARGFEIWNFRGWIVPNDFGLSDSKELELWQIKVLSGRYIVFAAPLGNNHGLLPVAIGMPCRSGLGVFEPSYAAKLLPLQQFASFSLNTHVKASRKALYGLTFYDQSLAPFMDSADMLGGKVPVKMTAMDKDIRKLVMQFNDGPTTDRTLDNIAATDAIMQKILPTDYLKQIAGLERATMYQAAATVQAANRRSYKNAKVLDNQCFAVVRLIQFYNIIQYGDEILYINEQGQEDTFPVSDLIETMNPDALASDSLRGIDKLVLIESMREVLNATLQNAPAMQQIDVIKLIDYMTSLQGDKTDYNQFRVQSPIDNLPPELKDQAFQLLQQAMAEQEAAGQGQGGAASAAATLQAIPGGQG